MRRKIRVSVSFSPVALLMRLEEEVRKNCMKKEEKEHGEEELKGERDARKREVREGFWEDVIIRPVNSETGCGRQRLAC